MRNEITSRDNASADDTLDGNLRRKAADFLDAQTAAIDAPTQGALLQARLRACEARRRQWAQTPWLAWGGTGVGVALAASITALVILPGNNTGAAANADAALAGMLAVQSDFSEVALIEDEEAALADDLAFVAWLEETHEPG